MVVLETDDADDEADTFAVVVAELATYVFVVVGELMVVVAWSEFDVERFVVFGLVVVADNDNVDDFGDAVGFVVVVDSDNVDDLDDDVGLVVEVAGEEAEWFDVELVVVVDDENDDDLDFVAGFVDEVDGDDEDLSIVVVCVDCPSCVVVDGSVAGVVTVKNEWVRLAYNDQAYLDIPNRF